MTPHFDEFSKSLAESCSRRESLRAFGTLVAGAVLSQLPLSSVWAGASNACKTFCNRCPTRLRNQCLSACQTCNSNTSRLCGSCGSYVCCAAGHSCCSGACVDRFNDVFNCGACGNVCLPGPNEHADCFDGQCAYSCLDGAVRCNGTCTFLGSDPGNCGACGNVCPVSAPYCNQGVCSANIQCSFPLESCGGACVDILNNQWNCGGCGQECPVGYVCWFATCCDPTVQCCGPDCGGF